MTPKHRSILKLTVALSFTALLLFWCFHQVDLKLFLEAIGQARIPILIAACLGSISVLLLNTVQLKLFLPHYKMVSFRRMFHFVAIFCMTVSVVPFWGGHALFVYLLGHREKVGKTITLSVLTLDQLIEGFAKIFIFGVVAFTASFPEWMEIGVRSFLVLMAVVYTVVFLAAYFFRDRNFATAERPNTWKGRCYGFFTKWAHHLHILRDFRKLILSLCLATLMKLSEVAAIFLVQRSMGVGLGLADAFLVAAALSLATMLPLTPGRVGTFEAGALVTYQFLGIGAPQALAMGVLLHIVHTLPFVVLGYFSSLKIGFQRREVSALQSSEEALAVAGT